MIRLALAVAVLVIGTAAAALFAPPLRIERIVTEGADAALRAEAEIAAHSYLQQHGRFAGQPRLLFLPREGLAAELRAKLPRLHSVQVTRLMPGTVVLRLQEKVPVAFVLTDGRAVALDNVGRAIDIRTPEEALASGLPVVRNNQPSGDIAPGARVVDAAVVELLHDAAVQLPDRLGVTPVELIIPSVGSQELHVRTSQDWLLYFDARRPVAEQLRSLEQVITELLPPEDIPHLEYVDLRVAGKVFYRLRRGIRRSLE